MYEPETRELLERSGVRDPPLAVDLGCGPGWSTRLLSGVLNPSRTVGLDSSPAFIAEAREKQGPGLEFEPHDVVRVPFPIPAPDVMFCRFLLTHLRSLPQVLAIWAEAAAPGGWLIVHETETLETNHPALQRYYELLAQLQRHHGQTLAVGAILEGCLAGTGWRLIESERRLIEKPACQMAELHLANLRTWRQDEYAWQTFDHCEIDALEVSVETLVHGGDNRSVVFNGARQILARRA
jgi:SAM-dependent methyltransferase